MIDFLFEMERGGGKLGVIDFKIPRHSKLPLGFVLRRETWVTTDKAECVGKWGLECEIWCTRFDRKLVLEARHNGAGRIYRLFSSLS